MFQHNSKFICKECNKSFKKLDGLSKHINKDHFNAKFYYDKWILKDKKETKCKICGNDVDYKPRGTRKIHQISGYQGFNIKIMINIKI